MHPICQCCALIPPFGVPCGPGIAYLIFLSNLMPLTPDDARAVVPQLSESFGRDEPSLGHTETGENLAHSRLDLSTNSSHPSGLLRMFVDFFGKMLLFRDFRFVFILSCTFELVECSLSWLIPEFHEYGAGPCSDGSGQLYLAPCWDTASSKECSS